LVQHRGGAAVGGLTALFLDVDRLHDAVLDQGGETLAAASEAGTRHVGRHADRVVNSQLPSGQEAMLSSAPRKARPGRHDELVVDGNDGDRVDALGDQRILVLDKPGRWLLLQVGVNAPGRPISTTFLPEKTSSVVSSLVPSGVTTLKVAPAVCRQRQSSFVTFPMPLD
jgi:hypothetical protein